MQLCAICEKNNAHIVYKSTVRQSKINERTFSARRMPDRIHYQIVRCDTCGLLYSNPILEDKKIEALYRKSFIRYDDSLENLKQTYGYYLKKLEAYGVKKRTLLDIGCGNGFFLEEALRQGYQNVFGVEPGKESINKANPAIKKTIIADIFKPGLFNKNFFDVICCLQTFDHIANPNAFLTECYSILKKNGLMLFLQHDEGAFTNRLLGEKSPIIDIEHTYIYSKKTIRIMFIKHHFEVLAVLSAFNIHYLGYWIHLFPFPESVKKTLMAVLRKLRLFHSKIRMKPGNLVIIAKK